MEFRRLQEADDARYAQAMALYAVSFPSHEQRAAASQRAILKNSEYHFDLCYDEDRFVGIMLYWETQAFLYVEHFCIEPLMRSRSYGQKALALLKEKGKPILLEIDPIVDEISRKRKGFYERAGFRENPHRHIHPPYHANNPGHELIVLSFPDTLTQAAYEDFNRYLCQTVMGTAIDEAEPAAKAAHEPAATRTVDVVAALIRDNDRFMICQRPPHKARGLLWEFVGGKVEPGETNEQALIRECREELAVTVSVGARYMDVLHEYPDLTVHLTLYHATIADGVPQKLEHHDIRWIRVSEIAQYNFCPADRPILQKMAEDASAI